MKFCLEASKGASGKDRIDCSLNAAWANTLHAELIKVEGILGPYPRLSHGALRKRKNE